MSPAGLALYLGWALVYALAAALPLMGLSRLAGLRIDAGRAALATATLFVVFLGLHPFPDPATLDCSAGGTAPILRPFAFTGAVLDLWRRAVPLADWPRHLTAISSLANFVFLAGVGALLATQTRRARVAVLWFMALSGGIELMQLSALFGIYPCPYRHFEVDDLILNIGGGLTGFALTRALIARRAARLRRR